MSYSYPLYTSGAAYKGLTALAYIVPAGSGYGSGNTLFVVVTRSVGGQLKGDTLQWDSASMHGVTPSGGVDFPQYCAIGIYPNGSIYLAYVNDADAYGNHDIYYEVSHDEGHTWSTPAISPGTGPTAGYPGYGIAGAYWDGSKVVGSPEPHPISELTPNGGISGVWYFETHPEALIYNNATIIQNPYYYTPAPPSHGVCMSGSVDGSKWSYVAIDSAPADAEESTEGWRNHSSTRCHYFAQLNVVSNIEGNTPGNQVSLADGTLYKLLLSNRTRIKRQITLPQTVYNTATATLGTWPGGGGFSTLDIPLTHSVPVTPSGYTLVQCGLDMPVDWYAAPPALGTALIDPDSSDPKPQQVTLAVPTFPTEFIVAPASGGTANTIRVGVALDVSYANAANLQIQIGSDSACITKALNGTGSYVNVDFTQNRYSLNPLCTVQSANGDWEVNSFQSPLYLGVSDSQNLVTKQGMSINLPITYSGTVEDLTINSVQFYFATPRHITDNTIGTAPVFDGGLPPDGGAYYLYNNVTDPTNPHNGEIWLTVQSSYPPGGSPSFWSNISGNTWSYGSNLDLTTLGVPDAYGIGSSTPTTDVHSGMLAAMSSAGGSTLTTTLSIVLPSPVYPMVLSFYETSIYYVYEQSSFNYYLLVSTNNGATWDYAGDGPPVTGLANLAAANPASLPSLMVEDDNLVIGWVENNGTSGMLPKVLVSADRGLTWH